MSPTDSWFAGFIQAVIAFLTAVAGLFVIGCAPNAEPIERSVTMIAEKIIVPVTNKAIEELQMQAGSLHGGAQVIEPGWRFEGEGFWCTGIKVSSVIRTTGVSGQIAGSVQASKTEEPDSPPGD